MKEYIPREEALNFDLSIECEPEDLEKIMEGMARYAEYIKTIPAADVRPAVKGRWLRQENSAYSPFDGSEEHTYQCSMCHELQFHKSNFCPVCGSEML